MSLDVSVPPEVAEAQELTYLGLILRGLDRVIDNSFPMAAVRIASAVVDSFWGVVRPPTSPLPSASDIFGVANSDRRDASRSLASSLPGIVSAGGVSIKSFRAKLSGVQYPHGKSSKWPL